MNRPNMQELTERESLCAATANAAAFWTVLGRARGHRVVRLPGLLVVDGPPTCRVLVLDPCETDPDQVADVVANAEGPVTVEDAFACLDLRHLPLIRRELPVMVKDAADWPPPALPVTEVATESELTRAEQIILTGFPVAGFAPGQLLPPGVLDQARCYLAWLDRRAVGACVHVPDQEADGVYWVTTLPEARSRGIGRALMHAMLRNAPGLTTLTAAAAGKPLYESLAFRTVAQSAWWIPTPISDDGSAETSRTR